MTFEEYANSSAHREPGNPDEPSASTRPGPDLRHRRRLLTSAAVALTAIIGVTAAHAASAAVGQPATPTSQPTASSSEDDLWHRQDLLSGLRTWIEAQPGINTSGYIDSINDPDAGSTILAWHGPPNRLQRQIIDEAHRRNIPISIQRRKHSRDDLERAVKQLIAIESGTGVFQNFTVSGVGTRGIPAFDGVIVKGDYIHPPGRGIPTADTALAQALAAKTGVAVEIERGRIVPLDTPLAG